MRHLLLSLLVPVLALPALAHAQDCVCPERTATINCGHRGTGNTEGDNPFPENTIPSFLQAAAEGAPMVELDVQHSSDGAVVVIHDEEVDDVTDGTGCVGDLTLAELQALDAGVGSGMEGEGVTIPTLDEVLDAVDIGLNIEIKTVDTGSCPHTDLAALAADVVAAVGGDTKDRQLFVSSFDAEVLAEARDLSVDVYLGRIAFGPAVAQDTADADFDAIITRFDQVDAGTVTDVGALGLDLGVYTVNDPADLSAAVDLGVQLLITDEPDLLEAIFADLCADFLPDPECDEGDDDDSADDDDDDDDDGADCSACASTVAGPGPGAASALLLLPLALLRRRRPIRPVCGTMAARRARP